MGCSGRRLGSLWSVTQWERGGTVDSKSGRGKTPNHTAPKSCRGSFLGGEGGAEGVRRIMGHTEKANLLKRSKLAQGAFTLTDLLHIGRMRIRGYTTSAKESRRRGSGRTSSTGKKLPCRKVREEDLRQGHRPKSREPGSTSGLVQAGGEQHGKTLRGFGHPHGQSEKNGVLRLVGGARQRKR